jgi:Zn-dependent protease/CBS domain-containing protein
MTASFRLGRIFGIEVGANWTWLIVFALVLWSLATAVFPSQDKGLSHAAYWAMAAVAAVSFFASILLHELGHALVARREGVRIEGITLWLFGGVARLRGRMPSARAEFRIAIGGPLVSVAIATVLLLVAGLAPLPNAVDGTVLWVGYMNAVVLVFNLIPALPLDGGRILHSGLWAWRDDLVWATGVGAAIGRGFGILMIGAGIASFVFGVAAGGLWLAFVGWFLNMAAQAEAQQVIARERLRGLRVHDLMVDQPVTVAPDLTIGEVIDEVARQHRHSIYPVVEDGRPVGLLPFRCLAETPRSEWDERRVRDCMLPREQVPTVPEGEPAAEALQELAQSEIGRALVVDDGRLAGLLSLTDLARAAQLGPPQRGSARERSAARSGK